MKSLFFDLLYNVQHKEQHQYYYLHHLVHKKYNNSQIAFDPKRPGVFNLLTIFRALSGKSEKEIESHFEGKGYGDLKGDLADLVIASLGSLQKRYTEITEDPSYVDGVLRDSVEKIRPIVVQTMKQVRKAMGFL